MMSKTRQRDSIINATTLVMEMPPTTNPCRIRRPYPTLPSHPDGKIASATTATSGVVTFRHPGYPDNDNILLFLPALDTCDESDDAGQFGLHHETARVACAILADCAWNGYLSTQRAAEAPRLMIGADDLLTEPDYYFHVPGGEIGMALNSCSTSYFDSLI